MSQTKTVFQSGLFLPGMDNYECPLRSNIADHEKWASATLTRWVLTPATMTYTAVSVKGQIQPQGTNVNGLSIGNHAKYAYTLFIADVIEEGDQIEDAYGNLYEVLNKEEVWFHDKFAHHICELMRVETATLYSLSAALTYSTSSITINIGAQGVSAPFTATSNLSRSKYNAITSAAIQEGDVIADNASSLYTISGIAHYPTKRSTNDGFKYKAAALTPVESVTLKTLTLGATADSITGHFPTSYVESTVYAVMATKAQSLQTFSLGYQSRTDYLAALAAAVYEGDLIEYNGVDYVVKLVLPTPTQRTDGFNWNICQLIRRDYAEQPATSGTWHTDSLSVKTDPRNRIKVLIDTYLTATNIKKDDGTTNASTATCFDGATYPLTRIFTTKAVDAVAVISRKTTNTLYTDWVFGHKPYAFNEQVQIEIYAVNKSGITATNLVEQFEQEIRRIFTTYDAYTNVRDLDSIAPSMEDLGYCYLYKTTVNIQYKRRNDDFTPTYPTITWGPSVTATGTYTFPNVTKFQYKDPNTGEIRMLPPGRQGDLIQILGNPDFEIILTCDMSVEPAAKTWKRAQTAAKTDYVNWQVFDEIKFTGTNDATKVYQTFNYGGGATIPVRLGEISIDGEVLTVPMKRYSSADQAASAYTAYHGLGT
jgi:hypothetical protein